MGPYVLPLAPWPNNNMFGRNGFYIHGDTAARNQTASNGCIVLDRQYRLMIAQSGDNVLTVTA
jgi:non-ribosomal peptide synthetase component E (peptide arylation enzyme)